MAEYYGQIKKQSFNRQGNKWVAAGEPEIEEDSRMDIDHWQGWADMDKGLGAKTRIIPLSIGSSVMHQYHTTSPDGKMKTIYTRGDGPIRSSPLKPKVEFGNDLRPIKR